MAAPAEEQIASNSRSTRIVFWCFAAVYLTIIAGKPTWIRYDGIADETLFMNQALNIIQGHWLGGYNVDTLVKGPGYPIFLAINYMTGLSISMAQSILFFLSTFYFCHVVVGKARPFVFSMLLASLLFAPLLFEASMQRLLRDTFYSCLTLIYFAAAIQASLAPRDRVRWGPAVVAGIVAGVLWITREEGIWILPATTVLLGLSAFEPLWRTRSGLTILATRTAIAVVAALVVIMLLGFVNLYVYGRFTTAEMKDADFQAAMAALQRASVEDRKSYLPVPKAARLRIYEQSPSFAKLRSFFDPEGGKSPANWGCEFFKNTCGDIAGGWFMWAFREGAARIGAHSDPNTAARYYRAVATEIDIACAEGRLKCSGWSIPFMPVMTAEQVRSIPHDLVQALSFVAFVPPMSFQPVPSVFMDNREQVLALLNYPIHVGSEGLTAFQIVGWYRWRSDDWITISGSSVQEFSRLESPDLVTHFSDSKLSRNRFMIEGACRRNTSCAIEIADAAGHKLSIDPRDLAAPFSFALGDGTLYVDALRDIASVPSTVRTKLYGRWTFLLGKSKRILSVVVILGAFAFAGVVLLTLIRRQMSKGAAIILVLGVAVLTRALLLAVINASSFPVIQYSYCAPAIFLAVAASIMAICELIRSAAGDWSLR